MLFGLLGIFVSNIEIYEIVAAGFHLVVDSASHDITRSERQAFVVFLHKFLAIASAQHGAIAAHSLGNEECGMRLAWAEKCCGVELHKLHVFDSALGAIHHCDAIAGGDERVGGGAIYGTDTTGSHQCNLGEESVHFAGSDVEHIGAIASDILGAARYNLAQMVLSEDFDGEIVLKDVDILMFFHRLDKAVLNFGAGVVFVVEDTKFRVSTFAVQVEIAVLFLVEVYAPVDELSYLRRRFAHYLFYRRAVA